MKAIRLFLSSGLLLLGTTCLAQPMGGPMGPGMMGGGGMMGGNASPRRFYVMRNGLPEAYRNLHNPLSATADNITAGKTLYDAQCALCHGASGRGDGAAASTLNPRPSDLVSAVHTPIASDAYLYWTIGEGGATFSTGMPSFKNNLQADQAWKIILYLRSL